jgi:hypothetical protein
VRESESRSRSRLDIDRHLSSVLVLGCPWNPSLSLLALEVHPKVTAAVDGERILYGQVKSIANSGANQALLGSK